MGTLRIFSRVGEFVRLRRVGLFLAEGQSHEAGQDNEYGTLKWTMKNVDIRLYISMEKIIQWEKKTSKGEKQNDICGNFILPSEVPTAEDAFKGTATRCFA